MPRVTDEYRRRRRDEIAEAALRRVASQGFARTSMADIIEESGLSAGAIYSHFAGKAEIAQYLGARVAGAKFEEADARLAPDAPPRAVLEELLAVIEERGLPTGVALQVWAEAGVDEGMREVVQPVLDSLLGLLRGRYARVHPPEAAQALADATIALVQGYVVRRSVDPSMTRARYLAGVDAFTGTHPGTPPGTTPPGTNAGDSVRAGSPGP